MKKKEKSPNSKTILTHFDAKCVKNKKCPRGPKNFWDFFKKYFFGKFWIFLNDTIICSWVKKSQKVKKKISVLQDFLEFLDFGHLFFFKNVQI
jgi:hypothetical protein